MPFDWRDGDTLELEQRYRSARLPDQEVLGVGAWSSFIQSVGSIGRLDFDGRSIADDRDPLSRIFQAFLGAIHAIRSQRSSAAVVHPVVFVSHQRSDLAEAERIAYLATQAGIDYWLDIHDPLLTLASHAISPNDPRYPYIIAAIIEMALLNSSHLIAVHTASSQSSKWVPYELGRVRDRNLLSANAGGWFHPTLPPRQCGDYVHLCRIAQGGEHGVIGWLRSWAPGALALSWHGGPTAQLP
jgi:hypothetical protein